MKNQLIKDLNIWPTQIRLKIPLIYVEGSDNTERPTLTASAFERNQISISTFFEFVAGIYILSDMTPVYADIKAYRNDTFYDGYGFWIIKDNLFELTAQGLIEIL